MSVKVSRPAASWGRTRLSTFAAGVTEAGWLAALAVVPLFLSPYSDRAFDPAKSGIVRILAAVMCAAWLIARMEPTRERSPWWKRNPAALPAVALLLANVLGTAASISPATSLMGDPRGEGLYTTASYVAIFLIAADRMRSLRQVERAITVALLASFPAALYAILQEIGLDPLRVDRPAGGGPPSTTGNPAFLGGYLALVAPLVAARLLAHLEEASASSFSSRARRLAYGAVVIYGLLLGVQIAALLVADVRGPVLGLAVGLGSLALLHAVLRGARRVAIGAVLAAVALLVGTVILAPGVTGRTAQGADAAGGQDPTARVRVLLWEGSLRLALPHAPLRSAGGGSDGLNALRPLIGYGPGSLYAASAQVSPAELTRLERSARPDRSHNETMDVLVQTGLPGAVSYLLLLGTLLYVGIASLGFGGARRARNHYVAASLVAASLAAVIAALTLERAYIAVAIPAGLLLGSVAFVLAIKPRPPAGAPARGIAPQAAVTTSLLAALVAHFVETQVGIATATSRTSFWVLAAALVSVGTRDLRPDVRRGPDGYAGTELRAYVAVTGLVLVTLAFDFVNRETLGALPGASAGSTVALLILIVGTLGVAAALVFAETWREWASGALPAWRGPALFLSATLAVLCSFAAVYAYALRGERIDVSALMATPTLFALFMIALLALLAAAVAGRQAQCRFRLRSGSVLAGAVLLVAGALWLNVRTLQADIVHEQAPRVYAADRLVQRFDEAASMQPLQDQALAFLADAQLTQAWGATPGEQRASTLRRAEQTLLDARGLNPFDPDRTLELARLHEEATQLPAPEPTIESHFRNSVRYYAQAVRLGPTAAEVRVLYADLLRRRSTFLRRRGDSAAADHAAREARRQLDRALSLDPARAPHPDGARMLRIDDERGLADLVADPRHARSRRGRRHGASRRRARSWPRGAGARGHGRHDGAP